MNDKEAQIIDLCSKTSKKTSSIQERVKKSKKKNQLDQRKKTISPFDSSLKKDIGKKQKSDFLLPEITVRSRSRSQEKEASFLSSIKKHKETPIALPNSNTEGAERLALSEQKELLNLDEEFLPLTLNQDIEIANFCSMYGIGIAKVRYGLSSPQIRHLVKKGPSSLLQKENMLREKERDLKLLEEKLNKKRYSIGRHKKKFNEFLVMEEVISFIQAFTVENGFMPLQSQVLEKAVSLSLNAPHKIMIDESWYFTFKNRYSPELDMLETYVEKKTLHKNRTASDEFGIVLE